MMVFARLAGALALAATLSGGACFSERVAGGAVPTGLRCEVPLDGGTFGTTLVAIRDFAFVPAQVRIRTGTTVTWVNCEPTGVESHTTTADGGAWSSPLMAPGATFSRRFDTPGTFAYHCDPHPFMQATIIVE